MDRALVLLLTLPTCVSCVGPGMLTDGTSVSVGTQSRGALRYGSRLSFRGDGYLVPRRWQERRRNFGTDELVQLLVRAARRVQRTNRAAILGIADLSPRGGGPTPEHRSHRSGRDVDLLYYGMNPRGTPLRPSEMWFYDRAGMLVVPTSQPAAPLATSINGIASAPETPRLDQGKAPPAVAPSAAPPAGAKLDLASNWALIKALVTDPAVSVQWIFIGRPIATLLLKHAQRIGEPEQIIRRAVAVMHQPSDAQSHMDHLHVRIFCSRADRRLGCKPWGPSRWLKKEIKYLNLPPRRLAGLAPGLVSLRGILRLRGI